MPSVRCRFCGMEYPPMPDVELERAHLLHLMRDHPGFMPRPISHAVGRVLAQGLLAEIQRKGFTRR